MKKNEKILIKIGIFALCVCFIIVTGIFLVNSGTLDLRMLMGNSLNNNYYCEPGGVTVLTGDIKDTYTDANGNYFVNYNDQKQSVYISGGAYFAYITDSNYQVKGDKCVYTYEHLPSKYYNGQYCDNFDHNYEQVMRLVVDSTHAKCIYYNTGESQTNQAKLDSLIPSENYATLYYANYNQLQNRKINLAYSPYKANVSYECKSTLVDTGNKDGVGDTIYDCKTEVIKNSGTSYSCPDGYKLSGTKCSKVVSINANKKYTCSFADVFQGYKLYGSKCTKNESKTATKNYKCPAGYSLSGSKCTKVQSTTATLKYSCPSGYTLKSTKCVKGKTTKTATKKYTCSSGYSLSGTKCNKTLSVASTLKYSCPAGYSLNGSKCIKTLSKNSTVSYSCSSGYKLNGVKCEKTETINATQNNTCPSDYTYNSEAKKCIKYVLNTAKKTYNCNSGDTLGENNMCQRNAQNDMNLNDLCGSDSVLVSYVQAPYYSSKNDSRSYACHTVNRIEDASKCPKDYSLSSDGKVCTKTQTTQAKSYATDFVVKYSSPFTVSKTGDVGSGNDINKIGNNLTTIQNDEGMLSISGYPDGSTIKGNVYVESDNNSIVSTEANTNSTSVKIKANNIGTARIKIKSDNIEKTITVNVVPVSIDDKPFRQTYGPAINEQLYGESDTISISISDTAEKYRVKMGVSTNIDSYKTVRYRTSNPNRFTVDSDGLITPVSVGEAYLVACVGPNDTDYCKKIKINVTK